MGKDECNYRIPKEMGKYLLNILLISILLTSVSFATCSVTSVSWSKSSATVGDTVTLTAVTSGCSGTATFTVMEHDVTSADDPVTTNPSSSTVSNNKATTTWIVEWQDDGLAGDPEYYFRVKIGTVTSSWSSDLSVSQRVDCTSGVCCDTSTKLYKSSSTQCDSGTLYQCSGTGAGSDVQKKDWKKYCSGSSSSCSGSTTGSWVTNKDCSNNQKCSGSGSSYSCACLNPCTSGQKTCDGTGGYQECKSDSDGCTYWSSTTSCSSDKTCSSGSCVCNNQCSTGDKQCSGSGYKECQTNSNGCRVWSSVKSCASDEKCSSGSCIKKCIVSNCKWEPTGSINEGATAILKADFSNCNGKTVTTKVYDADWPQSDSVWQEADSFSWLVSGSGTQSKSWTVKWIDDTGGTDINPEYVFRVWNDDGEQQCDSGSYLGYTIDVKKVCSNACTSGQKTCGTGGYKVCVQDTYGCWNWGADQACGTYEKCSSGACVAKTCSDFGYNNGSCSVVGGVLNPTECKGSNPYECKNVAWGWTGLPTLACWNKLDTCTINETCNDPLGTTGAHCETKPGCQYNNPSCGSDYDCTNNACVKKTGCQYRNPDCGANQECKSNTCTTLPCIINNCKWVQTGTVTEGGVSVASANFSNCINNSITVKVYDADWPQGDSVWQEADSFPWLVSGSGTQSKSWTVKWIDDTGGTDINPEYVFALWVNGERKCDSGSYPGYTVDVQKLCNNTCTSGQKTCDGTNGWKECTKDKYGCWGWGTKQSCGTYEKCSNASCVAKVCSDFGYNYSSCSVVGGILNPTECTSGNPYECKNVAWGWTGLPTLACWNKLDTCTINETCNDPLGTTGAHCDTKPGCQYNNPGCNAGYECKNNNCSLICQINKIYWSTSNSTSGDNVTMTVETGAGCNGKNVTMEIYENDDSSPDDYETSKTATIANGNATVVWTTRWQDDCILGICGDPEYYFIATADGKSKTSSDINVKKKVEPISNCSITALQWSKTSANDNENVDMTIKSKDCVGRYVKLEIYEDDSIVGYGVWPFSPEKMLSKTIEITSSEQKEQWLTVYLEDQRTNPEYYFEIQIGDKKNKSGLMSVYPSELTVSLADVDKTFANSNVTLVVPSSTSQGMNAAITYLQSVLVSKGSSVSIEKISSFDCNNRKKYEGKQIIIIGTNNTNKMISCVDLNITENSMNLIRNSWSSKNNSGIVLSATNQSYDTIIGFANIVKFGGNPNWNFLDSAVGCLWDGDMNNNTAQEIVCNVVPYLELAPDVRDSLTCAGVVNQNKEMGGLVCSITFLAAGIDIGGLFAGAGLIEGTIGQSVDIPLSSLKVALKNADLPVEIIEASAKTVKENKVIVLKGLSVFDKLGIKFTKESAETFMRIMAKGPEVAGKTFDVMKEEKFVNALARYTEKAGPDAAKIKNEVIDGLSWVKSGEKSGIALGGNIDEQVGLMRMFKGGDLTKEVEKTIKGYGITTDTVTKITFTNKLSGSVQALGFFDINKNVIEIAVKQPKGLEYLEDAEYAQYVKDVLIKHELGHASLFQKLGKDYDVAYELTSRSNFEELIVDILNKKSEGTAFVKGEQAFMAEGAHINEAADALSKYIAASKNALDTTKSAQLGRIARLKATARVIEKGDEFGKQVDTMIRATYKGDADKLISKIDTLSETMEAGAKKIVDSPSSMKNTAELTKIMKDVEDGTNELGRITTGSWDLSRLPAVAVIGIGTVATIDSVSATNGMNYTTPISNITNISGNNQTVVNPTQPGILPIAPCTGTWSCSDWSNCSNGVQTRSCVKMGDCKVFPSMPGISRNCEMRMIPNNTNTTTTPVIGINSSEVNRDVTGKVTTFRVLNRAEVKTGSPAQIEIQFELTNKGAISENVEWRAYVEGAIAEHTETTDIGANTAKTVNALVTSPMKISKIHVVLDYTNKIPETNEGNNEIVLEVATG